MPDYSRMMEAKDSSESETQQRMEHFHSMFRVFRSYFFAPSSKIYHRSYTWQFLYKKVKLLLL